MLYTLVRHIPGLQPVYKAATLLAKRCCSRYSCRVVSSGTGRSVYDDTHYSSKNVSPVTPLFLQAEKHVQRLALIDQHGMHSYGDILKLTNRLCDRITDTCESKNDSVQGSRIAFLCPNDASFVVSQWATWMSGGTCVPLSKSHPAAEIEYFVEDSGSTLVITTEEYSEKLAPVVDKLGVKSIVLQKKDYLDPGSANDVEPTGELLERRQKRQNRAHQLHKTHQYKNLPALIIYTSGTTGRPKGVLHTFGSLQAQVENMVKAWQWTPSDVILHVLPLHHIHGIVNVLMTSLYCGATCVMMPEFDAAKVWSRLLNPASTSNPRRINLFMAVPTVYAKLIDCYEQQLGSLSTSPQFVNAACSSKIRLMVSGSAALPQPIMERWKEITGHTLLERYGMTETGMVLTNPLHGQRVPGSVGQPFPSVEVCIARPNVYAENGYDVLAQGTTHSTSVTPGCEEESGELYVRGPSVFPGYWNKPRDTEETFTKDGWLKTGDTACYKDGVYNIMGRTSVDIIKSGGYKISALEIERHLLAHPDITDVAVLGLPDMTWGQKVAAVVVLRPETAAMELAQLRQWAEDLLPVYQLPTVLKVVEAMPRNAMGKVNKKDLLATLFAKELKSTL